jgi:prepilin-type N-terminal cleavage/methylation domain-containing protein
MIKRHCTQSGFTLVEMAIVLVIVGLMLGGLMMSLSQTRESTNRSEATAQLAEIEEALYGFAQANGFLPNPVNASGVEITAATPARHGFIPASALGLKGARNANGLLIDPWNNPLRYSVTADFAPSINKITMTSVGTLEIWDADPASGATIIASEIPAVVLSEGKNWATSTSAVGAEAQNKNANNIFVSAGYSEANFDDIITWLSGNILRTKLIAAGKLP